jgi:hypothetical protein
VPLGVGSTFGYPAWYNEGLVEFLSTATLENERLSVGDIPVGRARSLAFGVPLSVERVLTAREVLRWSSRPLQMFYAQSWALMHLLVHGADVGNSFEPTQIVAYLEAVAAGASEADACERAFGVSLNDLDRALSEYIAAGKFSVRKYSSAKLPGKPSPLSAGVAVPRSTLLYELSGLARAGAETQHLAARLLRDSVADDPSNLRAVAMLALLSLRAGEPAPSQRLEPASPADSDDATLLAILGNLRLERARQGGSAAAGEHVARARALYERSLALEPAGVRAAAGLGLTYAMAGPEALARGIEVLERAIALAPASSALRLQLAELYLRAERQQAAEAMLRSVMQQPHAGGDGEPLERLNQLLGEAGLAPVEEDPTYHLEPQLAVEEPFGDRVVRARSCRSARCPAALAIDVTDRAEVIDVLARIRLTGLDGVKITNLRTGVSARAVRVFADGSFDGYVPLEPGENTIEIVAELSSGVRLTAERRVVYAPVAAPTPEQEAAARELLDTIRRRTEETRLLIQPARASREADGASAPARSVEIETAPPDAP